MSADYSIEPGTTLSLLRAQCGVDAGYIEEAIVEFAQSKGLGEELAAFLRQRFAEEIQGEA
jgi:hypothetical protein